MEPNPSTMESQSPPQESRLSYYTGIAKQFAASAKEYANVGHEATLSCLARTRESATPCFESTSNSFGNMKESTANCFGNITKSFTNCFGRVRSSTTNCFASTASCFGTVKESTTSGVAAAKESTANCLGKTVKCIGDCASCCCNPMVLCIACGVLLGVVVVSAPEAFFITTANQCLNDPSSLGTYCDYYYVKGSGEHSETATTAGVKASIAAAGYPFFCACMVGAALYGKGRLRRR